MSDTTRQLTATVIDLSTTYLEKEMSLMHMNSHSENIIIDLKNVQSILSVIWFRKLRASFASYNKVLLGACNPGICLENLKSASISIIEPSSLQIHSASQNAALATVTETEKLPSPHLDEKAHQTIIHHGHLRGGQSLSSLYSDIIVVGNLNYGSEVMAGGNIHILGALNGRALAGTHIGNKAIISAFSLRAELISIDGYYLSSDEIKAQNQPISIVLQNEEICIRAFENH